MTYDEDEIRTILAKVIEVQNTSPDSGLQPYSPALREEIVELVGGSVALMVIDAITRGLHPHHANEMGRNMLLPLAFHIGMSVGVELEANRTFTQMMGKFDDD